MSAKITKRAIEKAQPGSWLHDGNLELYVGARKSTWYFRHGRGSRKKIGHYPELSPADARREAAKLIAAPPSRTGRMRFGDLYDRWHEEHGSSLASGVEIRQRYENHIEPVLGGRKVGEITRGDVQRLVDRLSPALARKVRDEIFRVYAWGERRELVDRNPARGVEVPPQARRSRVLTHDELRRLIAALPAYPPRSYFLLGVLLGGLRPGAAAAIRWDEFEGDVWWQPPESAEAKKKVKTGEPRPVPVSNAAQFVLRSIPRTGEYLFQSPYGTQPLSRQYWHDALTAASKGMRPFTWHDAMRRTTATLLQELGVAPHVIEALQGRETRGAIEQVYQRYAYEKEQRAAVERLGAWLTSSSRRTSGE